MTTLSKIADPVNNAVLRPVSKSLPSGLGARVPDSPKAAMGNFISSVIGVGAVAAGGLLALASGVGTVLGAGLLAVLAASSLGVLEAVFASGTNWVGIGVGSPP